jgi:hypothetical protein
LDLLFESQRHFWDSFDDWVLYGESFSAASENDEEINIWEIDA